MALKFTDDNFDKEVLQSDLLVVVDFFADWCAPCTIMAPIMDELCEEFDGIIKIGNANIDTCPVLRAAYQIVTIPFTMLIKNGELVDSHSGTLSKSELENIINTYKQ